MRKLMTAGLAGLTLVAGVATTSAAAADVRIGTPGFERVQYYGGYGHRGYYAPRYHHRGYNYGHYRRRDGGDAAAAAIVGGVLGFALGAAVAGPPRTHYSQPYYSQPYYGYSRYHAPRYYAPRYYAPPLRYYAPAPYYGRTCYDGYRYYC
jgi:hypothetical protein